MCDDVVAPYAGTVDVALLLAATVALVVGMRLAPLPATGTVVGGAALLTALNQSLDPGVGVVNDLVFFLVVLGGPALVGSAWTTATRRARQLARLAALRSGQVAAEVEAARVDELGRLARTVQQEMVQAVGAITLQAEGALRSEAEVARAAAEPIERSARAALDLLREHVGVLRRSASAGHRHERPGPGTAGDVRGGDVDGSRHRAPVPDEPRPPLTALDGLSALAAVPTVVEVLVHAPARGPWWANGLLALAMAGPLLLRRRRPLAAVAAALALMLAASLLLTPHTALVSPLLTLALLAYAVGAHGRGPGGTPVGLAVLLVGGAVVEVAAPGPADPATVGGASALVVFAVLAGATSARHARQVRRLRELTEQIEEGARAEVRLARARERLAVARDLHDSVAAAMTVICLHASVVARQRGIPAEQVRASLETVLQTARDAARELRDSLDPGDGAPALSVADAVAQGRRAGLEVRLERPALPLPATTEAVLARTVRESLVNVARHAPGATVTVRIDVGLRDGTEVAEVEVVDQGPEGTRTAAPGTGTGLVGLAERFAAAGGLLEYGPVDPRGFRVHGRLPGTGVPR
ncbi:MAG: hypothetical protein DCC50_02775 [Acidobacteria bacterium]|nr:MAG: hypothetical protein DCC50_02775 [Acidobacteriota bacterium]